MAFDLIPRQMVAFHGEGILQTKHFHDDDIEGGNVQPSHSPSYGAHFLGGGQTRKLMTSASTHIAQKQATETSSELAQRQSQSIATSLSLLPSCIFLPP